MGEVVTFPGKITDNVVLEPDAVLEGNKGHFQQLIIVGYDLNGDLTICSTHGSRDVLWMIERARIHLLTETE